MTIMMMMGDDDVHEAGIPSFDPSRCVTTLPVRLALADKGISAN